MQSRYELLGLESIGDCYLCQFAVDGHVTQAFWVHKSVREHPDYAKEDAFMAYLHRTADDMLSQYGDILHGRAA